LLPEMNLKTNRGIFFQIQFKGLAGISSRVDTMLKNGIYGYEPLENF
jgi:LPS-assembly protein